jgi:hypothetical protein
MIRRLPNAEHSCAGHEISIFFTLRSFFLSVYEKQLLPRISWNRPNNSTHGIINAIIDKVNGPVPSEVKAFYAKTLNSKRRDFRLVAADPNTGKPIPHPVIWESSKTVVQTVETSTQIKYQVAFLRPISGWFGFFIQFSFPGLDNTVLEVTTETNVIPETYPFPDCTTDSCYGKLV